MIFLEMGVTYKFLPKIEKFILKKKKDQPRLSCRKLSHLVRAKFGISLGKSRISWFLKKEGISSPVGRKRKRPYTKRILPYKGLGNFFLKCADLSLKGISSLIDPIRERFPKFSPLSIQARNETLLYLRLLEVKSSEEMKKISRIPESISKILEKNYKSSTLISYLNKLEGVKVLNLEFFNRFVSSLEEGLYLEFLLSGGDVFYLDAQIHSVWSKPNVPFDLSLGINKIKEYLNESFLKDNQPLILQGVSGFDTPTKEFFFFLRAMEKDVKIKKISLYSEATKLLNFEPIEVKKRYFTIGLWPWQYRNFRTIRQLPKVRDILTPFGERFQVTEIEIELREPKLNQRVRLRGGILRSEEKIRIIILTNLLDSALEEIVLDYVERWPNLEEGLEDFSKKIEFFTHKEAKRISLPKSEFSPVLKLGEIFGFWLENLNHYCQKHFFPLDYREFSLSELRERFYNLEGRIERRKGFIFVRLTPPKDYPYLSDLAYACRRVNELDITTPKGERIYFELQLP